MIVACWSPKPGSGTSVVTCALATMWSRRGRGALLVDLGGDAAAIMGRPTPPLGLGDILSGTGGHRLGDVSVPVDDRLDLIAPGLAPTPVAHHPLWNRLTVELSDRSRDGDLVFVDVGDGDVPGWLRDVTHHTVLVIRPCYLALRRAVEHPRAGDLADSVIVVSETDRALSARDVAGVLNRPVVAEIPVHPDIARRVDAGLLTTRLPDRLAGPLSEFTESLG